MTLDQMIKKAVFGGTGEGSGDPTQVKVAAAERKTDTISEAEKIATTLEFIGRRGVENMVKEASASAPPPGTNIGTRHPDHAQKTVKPHKGAPPMSEGGKDPSTNASKKPGDGKEQPKPRGTGQTHHPALASSRAAIDFDKREKAKQVNKDLSSLFDAKPFADPKLKENLTGAAGKGDKNINVKTASDKAQLLAALNKKRAEAAAQRES